MEIFNAVDENIESSLLQTIRIPKNLLFLSDKLPQPNYEKKPNKKNNNSFSDENKNELPDININQKANISKRRNEKRSEKDSSENNTIRNRENSEEKNSNEKQTNLYIPSNSDENKSKNNDNNNDGDIQAAPKRKKRIDNNDRSLDNIINNNVYSTALGSNNIKILKSENLDNSNNSLIRDRSPYDEASLGRRKNKDSNNIMMLPNIKNQINYDLK